ncbi:hypothetical protein VB638_15860, partial [Dolichospermum sp. UHCC 0684]|uniref:hypothetical protein n=1 Tax=Dolichospermum sp. UHCC 0684 TaxID=3110242 RepID=UPI002B1EDB5B
FSKTESQPTLSSKPASGNILAQQVFGYFVQLHPQTAILTCTIANFTVDRAVSLQDIARDCLNTNLWDELI